MSKMNPSERPWLGDWVAGIESRHLIFRPRLFAGGFAEPAAHLSSGSCQRAQLVCLLCSETQGCVLQQMGPVQWDRRLEGAEGLKGLWDRTTMG